MPQTPDPYASRVGGAFELRPRPDPVIWGDGSPASPYALSADQLSDFERDGVLVLPGRMADVCDALREEVEALKARLQGKDELVLEPDSAQVRSIFAPHIHSAAMAEVARDRRLLDPVMQILGSEAYIHQARVNTKLALSGRSFQWHSDFETWHVEDGLPRPRVITGWLFLDENTVFNGSLFVIPGSHRRYLAFPGTTPESNHLQSLRKQEYGSPTPDHLRVLADAGGGLSGAFGPPGTVVFHEGNLMHGSPDNLAPYNRTNLFFVYNSVENRPARPFGGGRHRPEFLGAQGGAPLSPRDPGEALS